MNQSICLNMIVKNEEDIIKKTLENVCSKIKISYWVICDTGSTDSTRQIIKDFFKSKNIKGKLYDIPWKNFGYNRTKALELAYKKSDFLLHFDADDKIEGNLILPSPMKKGYSYYLKFGNNNITYNRICLVDNSIKWYYEGVMHEVISTKESYKIAIVQGDYKINTNVEISNRNKNKKDKFTSDATILEEALKNTSSHLDSRYCFYCAQSWKCAGNIEKAIKWYTKRLEYKTGWIQEKYCSCLELGYLYSKINEPEKAFYYYCLSYEYDNNRLEAFYEIMHNFRVKDMHNMAISYYKLLKPLKEKEYKLFLIGNIYDYLLDIEITISAYYTKDYNLGIKSFKNLFKNAEKIPDKQLKLIHNNLKFYIDKFDDKDLELISSFDNFNKVLYNKGFIKSY